MCVQESSSIAMVVIRIAFLLHQEADMFCPDQRTALRNEGIVGQQNRGVYAITLDQTEQIIDNLPALCA